MEDSSAELSFEVNAEKKIVEEKLSKEEIGRILKVSPCLGIRSLPVDHLDQEMANGVVLGDFIKISRPKCMADSRLDISDEVLLEKILAAKEMVRKISPKKVTDEGEIDILRFDNLKEKFLEEILEKSNFAELYNSYLDDLVFGFINWTLLRNGKDIDSLSRNELISELEKLGPAFEVIIPVEENTRPDEYMKFEKNNPTEISKDEIKAGIRLEKEDVEGVREEQDRGGSREIINEIKNILKEKLVSEIRKII